MLNTEQIKSFEIERVFLHCLIKDPGWISEVTPFLKSDFFAYTPNQKIFSAIKSIFNENKTIDSHILISRLSLMGLTMVDGLAVDDYITAISNMSVNLSSKRNYLEELIKFYWSREMYKKLNKAQKFIKENLSLSFKEILSGTEKIVIDAITAESVNDDDDNFIDLYGEMDAIIDAQVGKQGVLGVSTPFPTFNRWYGPLSFGDLFVFAAPSKVGKSTFLSALANHAIEEGKGHLKVLLLDTELEGWRVACRAVASKSGVNEFFYRTGKFSEDAEKIRKTKEVMPSFTKYKKCLFHCYIPEASEDKIESVVRRWYAKNIGPEDQACVILDYLKFSGGEDRTGGSGGQDLKEYELVGRKTDRLKMLASSLPRTVCVSAIQTNRANDIAQSDRIKWFASSVFIINRKTPEEVGEEGLQFGTHVIKAIVTRNLGEFGDEAGAFSAKQGNKTAWFENFINLKFDNFKVTESGTYKDVVSNLGLAGQLVPKKTASDNHRDSTSKNRNF